ncbi:hypothetical protein KIH74_27090 [Kineosporia sp. J2-2]|uniref:DUF4352 domain-containing protein n=1 Tax=Kineosporia corallincola TaxID=2835133 RepID=A0ABS5TNF8_9ACTN|nr:hypothetical protein [Kineosporia corallincola]MBT0772639.1 hypothetical protein [Kineosporia corallincola]
MSRRMRNTLLAVVLVLALVAVAGLAWRLNDGSQDATPTTPTTSATGSDDPTAGELDEKYLSADPAEAEAVASEEGTVYGTATNGSGSELKHAGTLRILAVDAGGSSTHVRYSLSSDVEITPSMARYVEVADRSLRVPQLIAESADLRLMTGNWKSEGEVTGDCVCAWVPALIGPEAVELSILYPVLPESVTEVQFTMPGFEPLTAPVTRDQE